MDEVLKVDVHSNRTTAASMAIVSVVVYLAMINLQSILMPLAIAILLYFIIKPPEQIIYQKVGKQRNINLLIKTVVVLALLH